MFIDDCFEFLNSLAVTHAVGLGAPLARCLPGETWVNLDLQNIADYVQAVQPDHVNYPMDRLTDCRPPWRRAFFRYRWLNTAGKIEHWGCFVESPQKNDLFQTFAAVRTGAALKYPELHLFRWGFAGELVLNPDDPDLSFMAMDAKDSSEDDLPPNSPWSHPRPQPLGNQGTKFAIVHNYNGAAPYECVRLSDLTSAPTRSWQGLSYVYYFACALLHCKNTSLKADPIPSKLVEKRRRRDKVPVDKVYSLVIRVPGQQHQAEGRFLDPESGGTRFHLCRGHFKRFTLERPLFGKLTGRYWWPQHMRGDQSLGQVNKEYKPEMQGR